MPKDRTLARVRLRCTRDGHYVAYVSRHGGHDWTVAAAGLNEQDALGRAISLAKESGIAVDTTPVQHLLRGGQSCS